MYNNQGFTMIETLFVFFIIVMLSLFTMNVRQYKLSDHHVITDISACINHARLNAMSYKEKTDITFTNDELIIKSVHFNKSYQLPNGQHFSSHKLSYNDFGHIRHAKTVRYSSNDHVYNFVFQVGSGSFYVK